MARVLVCDDERHILRLVQVNLERQAHEVSTCDNGVECLARLRREPFDVLVVDGDLDSPSTREVLDEIEHEPEIHVRVIVLGDDPQDPKKPFGGPPPLVVSKPFKPAELLQAL
jgi:CheY-like chemotaxis protein